ncbi:MAG: M3 family metallopeptidase [Bacteroidales bacterium]|nr:M3 family metallopeptidase [Bacteroidales bacterium]
MAQNNHAIKENPLIMTWNTPYQTPPFSKIKTEHYEPAIKYALKVAEKEVADITENKSTPTFENTILALENSGKLLGQITSLFFNLNEANTNDTMQKVALEISPLLTEFSNNIHLNPVLFARIKTVYEQQDDIPLTIEQRKLLENTYKAFVRSGAMIENMQDKAEFRKVSEELSLLTLKFNQNVLADNNAYSLHITDKKDLHGLPSYAIEAAAELAKNRKLKGWVFTLDAPSYIPFITFADNRSLREELWRASNSKANHNDTNDNKDILVQIVNLRLRLAQLLGYKTFADYRLDNTMAGSSEIVNGFIDDLLTASLPFAKKDLDMICEYAKTKGFKDKMQRWDFSYWSEKLKNEKYDINPELLKPYFQLEKVKDGIFALADKLYDLEFKENKQIEKYHDDVIVYEVWDKKQRKFMAILYMDFFPRESKRSGAWMTDFRGQRIENGEDVRPLIQMVCNFTKPTKKSPSLLTFEEFNTFLHEFGHCLHGILTQCNYASLSGTNVEHDFVELPSQLMENFATEKDFLDMFAQHYKTGEKIPQKLIDKIIASERYLAGWLSIRQLFFGIIDMNWHSISSSFTGNVDTMENKASKRAELFSPIEGCMMSTQFSHIFGGGYAAGYYGYKWAEVLDADAFSLFKEKGIFNREVADSFRKNILSKGGKKDPMELYKTFRGQAPTKDALLKRCGFIK